MDSDLIERAADYHFIDMFRVIRGAGRCDRAKARAASVYVATQGTADNERVKALEALVARVAAMPTIAEALSQPGEPALADPDPVKTRIERMGERRKVHDQMILDARALLERTDNAPVT